MTVNRIFARNGVAFEMLANGRIERVLPPVLGEELKRTLFNTGDRMLDNMLDECRAKFRTTIHWCVAKRWSGCGTHGSDSNHLADPSDKKRSVKIILDAVTSVPSLRETEATELNSIGNSHLIRHSEISKVPVIDMDQVDCLFHRLFAMIQLLRKK